MKYSYCQIKKAYEEVIEFMMNYKVEYNSLDDKIAETYGFWGDDNYFLLIEFIDTYNLSYDSFEYDDYFEGEEELVNVFTSLLTLVYLPYWIIIMILEGVFKVELPKFPEKTINPRLDLTVGDMIAWRLNSEFITRKKLQISI